MDYLCVLLVDRLSLAHINANSGAQRSLYNSNPLRYIPMFARGISVYTRRAVVQLVCLQKPGADVYLGRHSSLFSAFKTFSTKPSPTIHNMVNDIGSTGGDSTCNAFAYTSFPC